MRTKTAVALITVYCVLYILLVSSYIRIVATLNTNPGYVPKGPPTEDSPQTEKVKQLDGASSDDDEHDTGPAHYGNTVQVPIPGQDEHQLDRIASAASLSDVLRNGPPEQPVPQTSASNAPLNPPNFQPAPGNTRPSMWVPQRPPSNSLPTNLGAFLEKDIYVCENDGLPRYCRYCNCWKPDRSHHCSEVGRCVMRMDHFCPWVGGVVAETSFRYFYQVVVYGTVFCFFLMGCMAALVQELRADNKTIDPKWVSILAL